MIKELENQFLSVFGRAPELSTFAPGRVNIIGEHTDYNEGYVLPFAIHQGIWFLAAPNNSHRIHIIAANPQEQIDIELPHIDIENAPGWYKFIHQVLKLYSDKNIIGFNAIFGGNLPIGAGVSSSSALTCGSIALIDEMNAFNTSVDDKIQKAVTAERGYGVQGGVMDQFTIFNGRRDKAILLDCRTNHPEYIQLDTSEYTFYLVNTQVKHNLIDTDYNQRHHECILAVDWINQNHRPISSLRDIYIDELPLLKAKMDKMLYLRTSFVVEENARVLKVIDVLTSGDYHTLGHLLYQSHSGLSLKYEVSCPELDWLVEYTKSKSNFIGARMMGGGFGGCTINLIKGRLDITSKEDLITQYYNIFGIKPDIISVVPSSGIIESLNES